MIYVPNGLWTEEKNDRYDTQPTGFKPDLAFFSSNIQVTPVIGYIGNQHA